MGKKRNLHLVKNTGGPPRKLGKNGLELWVGVKSQYEIDDTGGLAMLLLACEALDRAEACRLQIDRDGLIIRSKAGPRDNPLLKHELNSRAFVVRTIARLGLDLEAIKPIGRPARALGWRRSNDDET